MILEVSQMTNTIIHYTNDKVKQLSNEDLLKILNDNWNVRQLSQLIRYGNIAIPIINELLNRTKFIDEYCNEFVSIKTRLYCIECNLTDIPICANPNCQNKVPLVDGEFHKYCCKACQNSDKELHKLINKRANETCLKKYGCTNPFQVEEFKEKSKQTLIERYGVEHPLKSEDIKLKIQKTNIERYGHTCSLKNEDVIKKTKTTMIALYGVDNASKSGQIQKKKIITSMNKYGANHPMKSQQIKNKLCPIMEQKYGVEYPIQSNDVKLKMKDTLLRKYGVINISQTSEFHQKCHKKYTNPKYPGMTFGSSWEFKVYDFLKEQNIEFEYQPSISFEYEYDGISHTYHPDFKVGDKIYEVKGDNFFRINESTGKEEMYLPWKGNLSDEEYEYKCGLYEAKHQCMIINNVVILRDDNIKNLNISIF